MSYQKQLQEHYKAVRERLRMGPKTAPVVIKPKALPPPSAPCHTRNTLPPSPPPGLLAESEEKAIVEQALNYTSQERYKPFMGGRTRAQEDRFKDELRLSPRLPPLEGLNLNEPGAIRWQRMLHAVAKQHGVKAEEILSPSRRKEIIRARHEVCYRLRIELCFSYEKIAQLMKRDHTSVLHGVAKMRDRLLDEMSRKGEDKRSSPVYHPTGGDTHTRSLLG